MARMEKLQFIIKGDQDPVEFQKQMSFKKLQNVSKFLRKDFQHRLLKVNRNVRPVVKGLEKDPADRDKVDNEFLCGYFPNLKLFKELNISQNELLKVINVSTCHFVPRH